MKSLIICICIITNTISFARVDSDDGALTAKSDSIKKTELNIWELFQGRRSVRKYKSDPVPQEDILKIIDAARMAPTSGNQQPWKFLVVRDTNKINELKQACIKASMEYYEKNAARKDSPEAFREKVTRSYNNYLSAPVYIIILTDNNSLYPDYNHFDGPMAAAYLMLAARALGYGTVFLTDSITEEVTKEVFRIPDTYTRVTITPVGVPAEWPKTPGKKNLEDLILYDRF